MTDQNAPAEQAPAEQTTPQPTLESLYAEYNVPAATTQSNGSGTAGGEPVTPAATPTEQTPAGNEVAAIHQEVSVFRQELAADRQRRFKETETADLKQAVDTLAEKADLKGKEKVIKGFLLAQASEDQRLRALWDRRGENPQAWDKALSILSADVKKEFQVPNPQLEENQRAMDESQRAASATAPAQPSPSDDVMKMPDADFQQYWGRLIGRR